MTATLSNKVRAEVAVMTNAIYDQASGRITTRAMKAILAGICNTEEMERILKINVTAYSKDQLFAVVASAYLTRK